jgi:hypothetical protein
MLNSFFGQRKADQAASMGCHKVDRVRRDFFRRHAEVTLVFAVFVIHQDDHPAAANFIDRLFNRR